MILLILFVPFNDFSGVNEKEQFLQMRNVTTSFNLTLISAIPFPDQDFTGNLTMLSCYHYSRYIARVSDSLLSIRLW